MSTPWLHVKPMADLEHKLEQEFKDKELLRQALAHASAVHERHPMAFNRNQLTLAFVGDSVLKYAAARHLVLNGRDDVAGSSSELHKGTQTVIPNDILVDIARMKLSLEEYLIRGNTHTTISKKMYADCMEALLGAIALDCGTNQEVVFGVIEKLCSDRYEALLKPITHIRFKSMSDEDYEEELLIVPFSLFSQLESQFGSS